MVMYIPKKGLTTAEHAELDHSGVPGCGEETFDEAAHALTDHSTQLGVPSIAGLLDESAHDELDHTGLTGIPDEFNWDLDAATPFRTDHSAVDHTGLPGVGAIPTVASTNLLPGQATNIQDYSEFRATNFYAHIDDSGDRAAQSFTATGPGLYTVEVKAKNANMVLKGQIFTDNGGEPGTLVADADSTVSINEDEVGTLQWTDLELTESTTYWVVFSTISGGSYRTIYSYPNGGSALFSSNSGESWTATTEILGIVINVVPSSHPADNTIYLVEDTDTLYVYDINTFSWSAMYDISNLLDETSHASLDHTGLTGVPSIAGLLDETSHDLLDHTGLPGVGGGSEYFNDPVSAFANLPASGDDGDLVVVKDSHKIYIWDSEAATPCWRETNREITHEGVTVDASSWRNFQISLIDRPMLNILDFECIISKIQVIATTEQATPILDYDLELFTDSNRTQYGYWAQHIDTVIFEDKIPFLWEGGSTIYGRIINNEAAAITNLDIVIKYRV